MIEVQLSASEIPIEPGNTAQLTVTVTNRQTHEDFFALEVEGVDVEWYALPVPVLRIPPDSLQSSRILFKIARSSASRAETYPFLVRVKSQETGETAVQQATLVVKPFSGLQVEVQPRRAAATYFNSCPVIDVSVTNLGNHEETVTLAAHDPEEGCTYEFDPERITIQPGHTELVPLEVQPKTRPVLGSPHLFGYTVTARSIADSFVSGTANAQLERRPLLTLAAAAIVLLLGLGTGAFFFFRPKPVVLHDFSATPAQIDYNGSTTLSWYASNLAEGYIQPGNIRLRSGDGKQVVTPLQTTTYKIVVRGGGQEASREVVVVVKPPIRYSPPKITEFKASTTRIHEGEPVLLTWTVKDASEILLNPLGTKGDPGLYTSQQVTPNMTTEYALAVKGPGGTDLKKVKIEVVDPRQSIAEISYFKAKPAKITVGDSTTLSWKALNAKVVEINNGVGNNLKPADSFKVTPTITTIYTLTATDSKGNQVSKSVTVSAEPKEPPVDPNNPDNPGGIPPGGNPPPR